jgi:hypothetical protein
MKTSVSSPASPWLFSGRKFRFPDGSRHRVRVNTTHTPAQKRRDRAVLREVNQSYKDCCSAIKAEIESAKAIKSARARREKLREALAKDVRFLESQGFTVLHSQFEDDGVIVDTHDSTPRALEAEKLSWASKARGLTKRQQEIVEEAGALALADRIESLALTETERMRIRRWKELYDKAFFGKCRHTEEKRAAFQFLWNWNKEILFARESGRDLTGSEKAALLAPVIDYFNNNDPEFFRALACANGELAGRLRSKKASGTGDDQLDKWLLEYAIRIGRTAKHTVRELNQQFVQTFRAINDKKLREHCENLWIPLKPDARGKSSQRYGQVTGKMSPGSL